MGTRCKSFYVAGKRVTLKFLNLSYMGLYPVFTPPPYHVERYEVIALVLTIQVKNGRSNKMESKGLILMATAIFTVVMICGRTSRNASKKQPVANITSSPRDNL